MKRVYGWLIIGAVTLLAGALSLGAIACSDNDNDKEEPTATAMAGETEPAPSGEIHEVQITATGDPGGDAYAFDAPESIEGGVTRINFTNAAQMEDHQAQLVRLDEGVTYDDFTGGLAAIESEADVAALGGTLVGGPGSGPGGDNDNVIDLDAGEYVLLCAIPNPEGVPHFVLGMIQPLEVTEPMADGAELPAADVDVGLSEFEFDAPDTLAAGETTFEAVNNGAQPHEFAVAQLPEGFTVDDLLALFGGTGAPPESGEPPFTFYGQVGALGEGQSAQTTIDLAPGTYTVLCFLTDPETGLPHAALGMYKEIVVE